MICLKYWLSGLLLSTATLPAAAATLNTPDHVVIVIEENQIANAILGSPNATYINSLAASGMSYTNAHGTDHDSQPNYLELFSGANPGIQGVVSPLQQNYPAGLNIETPTDPTVIAGLDNSDNPNKIPFSTPNLAAGLQAAGKTFAGYSEDLPGVGSTVNKAIGSQGLRSYVHKHNPWVQWQGVGPNQLAASVNQPLTTFTGIGDYATLPTVSFVIPSESHDMHDVVSKDGLYAVDPVTHAVISPFATGFDIHGNPVNADTSIQAGDNWLKSNLDGYRQWALAHNSLLITLWDENDYSNGANNIAVIVDGPANLVQVGENNNYVNHFDVLKTLEDTYGAPETGFAATAAGLSVNAAGALSVPEPMTLGLLGSGIAGLAGIRRRPA